MEVCWTPFSQHLKPPLKRGAEVAGGLSPPREGQWRGRGSRGGRTLGWFTEKHGITKGYLLLRKMLSSIDGTQKQWAGTRSNGWVRGKAKGNRELFQLETGWNAGRRGIMWPISLKTLRAEVCSIWVTISTLRVQKRADFALTSISPR